MRVTDALLGEHGILYVLFERLEKELAAEGDRAELRGVAEAVGAALLAHARIEEEILFPALEARIGPAGPLAVMRAEHDEIEGGFASLPTEGDREALAARLRELLAIAREHFAKEEHVLFAMASEMLADELEELGRRWAERRRVVLPGSR